MIFLYADVFGKANIRSSAEISENSRNGKAFTILKYLVFKNGRFFRKELDSSFESGVTDSILESAFGMIKTVIPEIENPICKVGSYIYLDNGIVIESDYSKFTLFQNAINDPPSDESKFYSLEGAISLYKGRLFGKDSESPAFRTYSEKARELFCEYVSNYIDLSRSLKISVKNGILKRAFCADPFSDSGKVIENYFRENDKEIYEAIKAAADY